MVPIIIRKAMYLTNILLILLNLFLTINKSVGFCLFVFVFLITLAMHLQTSSYEFGYLKNEELFKYMDVAKIKIKSLYPMNKKQKISYYQYLATNILFIISIVEYFLFVAFLVCISLNIQDNIIFIILVVMLIVLNIVVLISHIWIGVIYKIVVKNNNNLEKV